MRLAQRFPLVILFLSCVACSRSNSQATTQTEPAELQLQGSSSLHQFLGYEDVRRGHSARSQEKELARMLELKSGAAVWTEPDSVAISVPAARTATQGN